MCVCVTGTTAKEDAQLVLVKQGWTHPCAPAISIPTRVEQLEENKVMSSCSIALVCSEHSLPVATGLLSDCSCTYSVHSEYTLKAFRIKRSAEDTQKESLIEYTQKDRRRPAMIGYVYVCVWQSCS